MTSNTSKKSLTSTSKKPSDTSKKTSKESKKSSKKIKATKIPCVSESLTESELPKHATEFSAGIDLQVLRVVNEDNSDHSLFPTHSTINACELQANKLYVVHTGVHLSLPEGQFGMLVPRSGMAKKGMRIVNSPGIIDSDYRGEIKIMVKCDTTIEINKMDRIAQLIVIPYTKVVLNKVDSLTETKRGSGGFGSTGK